jgi:demethylmenaquinone methyltransferase/2-methoxy-6-polyprenyl-1,4-benzoquinol methylase
MTPEISVEGRGEAAVAEDRVISTFDAAAPAFERHRTLPQAVPQAIRAAVLAALEEPSPRLLDLGAGTGRFGRPFIAAGDAYVGVDLAFGMLHEFAAVTATGRRAPVLAQADGERLPFPDATFDAVLMIQVFGGMHGWRRVLGEARRVLRPSGALVLGRSVAPADGVDARLRARLALILGELGVAPQAKNPREDAHQWLAAQASRSSRIVAATWNAERTARAFIDRHRTGARFSALPDAVKDTALRRLADWAAAAFGSLDAAAREQHSFELQIFQFVRGDAHA